MLATIENADIFSANRASGRIALSVAADAGRTRRRRVQEAGSLRVRFPNVTTGALEAVIVNTGGGMTGGDRFAIAIEVGAGANLVAGTAAAEKVYRSTGADAALDVSLTLAAGARLAWLPQETILFDRARLARRIDIDLDENAALIMAEAIVFGRAAMGESVREGFWSDRWRLRRGGRLVFAENVRLDGAIADKLARSAVAAGAIALATVLIAPGEAATLAAVRALAICRRGRHLGLERHRGGAAGRARRRCLAPRSDRAARRARAKRAATLATMTPDAEKGSPVFG